MPLPPPVDSEAPDAARLSAAARNAAEQWGLDVAELQLISLSENAVFRVDTTTGERLVLRLHRPGYNTKVEMESEMAWVESLRAAGFDAPAPQRAANGEAYLPVDVNTGEGTAETRWAGVISWVDGTNLEQQLEDDATKVSSSYHQVGKLLARLRQHSETWNPPPGFTRRRWDADGLVGLDPLWGRFWEVPTESSDRKLFQDVRRALHTTLSALPVDRKDFGLLHADLHLRNVMVDGHRMIIIDFDDSGFGWYVHELAVALHPASDEPWFDEARVALLAGYRTVHELTDHEEDLLQAFLTIRSLMIVAWLHARPELGLGEHVPTFVRQAAIDSERYLSS